MKKNIKKKTAKLRPARKKKSRSSWFEAFLSIPQFFHLVFIVILLIIVAFLFFSSGESGNNLYKDIKKDSSEPVAVLRHDVFSDHYVNDLVINKNASSFYYDNAATAFTFAPDYAWQDGANCSDAYCGLKPEDWNFAGQQVKRYCLSQNCLSLEGIKLFLNNREIKIPAEISGELRSVNVYPLSKTWLVGFVFRSESGEQGLAYSFDGRSFKNLDLKKEFPFVSRVGFEGASFGFGGDDDNFLVMYGGYDFIAYQDVKGHKTDVSRFFGLRVSDGGFNPIAFKINKGNDTVWYVCSLQEKEPRLIKLWQNSSDNIKGSLSLSEALLAKREKADSAWCRLNENNDLEIMISRQGSYYERIFKDNGFIQKDSVLVSKDIANGRAINNATFSSLLACDDEFCDAKTLDNLLQFTVSSDNKKFFKAELGQEINFPKGDKGLYYSISARAKNNDKNYSPWIDGLTAISYSFWD